MSYGEARLGDNAGEADSLESGAVSLLARPRKKGESTGCTEEAVMLIQ